MADFLYEQINSAKLFVESPEVPQFIKENLSENIALRDYQIQAISDTLLYLGNPKLSGNKQTHLLYHMATGSGKTVIMAMNILYYYSLGYRNFLFFTNQTSIVNKTRINFTEPTSIKYLFSKSLSMDGKNIHINVVDNFQDSKPDDINICFNTVQGIHSELFFLRENGLSLDDFKEQKVVLLADEAHHLNSATKANKDEAEEEQTWENTVYNIFTANKDNVLLEYTATCNLKDPNVLNKYKDKIIFNFALKEFREAGYTKEFNNFSSDTTPWIRTLQALVLSEFRKLKFNEHKIFAKPVVMLKSYRVADSKAFYKEFFEKLSKLTGEEIVDSVFKPNQGNDGSRFINNAVDYFNKINLSNDALAEMIKLDFSEDHAVMMNGESTDDDSLYNKVNTLDDKNNPYRIIFTVAKLNEGWDVLGLYDIVRLYETRQGGKGGQPSDFTLSEAQLIGRGARYFPFKFEEGQVSDKKKYTNNIDNPDAICETLLYHCMNDSRYITELKLALIKTGFEPDEKIEVKYSLKEEFKKTSVYSEGLIFTNRRVEKSRKSVTSLPDSFRLKNYSFRCKSGATSSGALFEDGSNESNIKTLDPIKFKEFELPLRLKAYRSFHNTLSFDLLKSKFPNLKSIEEFLTSDDYLGCSTVTFTIAENSTPTRSDKLEALKKIIAATSDFVQKIEVLYEGTDEFYGEPINKLIPSQRIRLISKSRTNTDAWGEGVSQNDSKVPASYKLDLTSKDWYVFNDNYGTSEEKKFVSYLNSAISDLKKKYDRIFLIRNELFFSIYSFNTGDKFEPDYILLLVKEKADKNDFLCVFVEPKGEHLLETDKWKGDFLLELENRAIPKIKFVDNNYYRIWGTPLYNEENTKGEFIDYITNKGII